MKTTSILVFVCCVSIVSRALGASLPLTGSSYSEDFDSLATSSPGSTTPLGWGFLESLSGANSTYSAGTGSSTTGDTYSFGASGSSERAFGQLRTGSLASILGVAIENQTGDIIQSLFISYVGEQWRLGAIRTTAPDQMDFQYSLDASSLNTGTWTDLDALDFVSPNVGPSTGALDGNAAANRTSLSATLSGLSLAPGQSIWFRWTDVDASSSDDGLAIDDFGLRAVSTIQPVPEPATWALISSGFLGLIAMSRSLRRRQNA